MSNLTRLNLKEHNTTHILAFGDSLTEGYADWGMTWQPYGPALQSKLSALLPDYEIKVTVNGRSGDCVCSSLGGRFLERLKEAAPITSNSDVWTDENSIISKPVNYDLIIMLGGTNDLAYKYRTDDGPRVIFEALKECYNHVLASGSSLLCLSVPERRADTESLESSSQIKGARLELNELIAKFVESRVSSVPAVYFMDLATAVPFVEGEDDDTSLWSIDGLHMTPTGYSHVGEILADFIHGLVVQ